MTRMEHNEMQAAELAIDFLGTDYPPGEFSLAEWHAIAWDLKRRLQKRAATLDDALQRFPDSAAAVALVATILRVSIEPVPEFEEDTRHDRIRAAILEASSEARTRAMVVCTALARIASECRTLTLTIKDEAGDPDVTAGKATVSPDGWLVVEMQGKEVARMPFNPDRPAEEAEKLTADLLAEYVVLHPQGEVEVSGAIGGAFDGTRPAAMHVVVDKKPLTSGADRP